MKPIYRQTINLLLITGTTYTFTHRPQIQARLARGLRRLSDQITQTLVDSLEVRLGWPLSQQQRHQWLTTWQGKAKQWLPNNPTIHPLQADLLDLLIRRSQSVQLQTDPADAPQTGRLYRLEANTFVLVTAQDEPYLFHLSQVTEIRLTDTIKLILQGGQTNNTPRGEGLLPRRSR